MDATFTLNEVALMIAILSKLDPESYATSAARAIIYKSKDMMESNQEYNRFRVVND